MIYQRLVRIFVLIMIDIFNIELIINKLIFNHISMFSWCHLSHLANVYSFIKKEARAAGPW